MAPRAPIESNRVEPRGCSIRSNRIGPKKVRFVSNRDKFDSTRFDSLINALAYPTGLWRMLLSPAEGCYLIGRIWTHTRTVISNFFAMFYGRFMSKRFQNFTGLWRVLLSPPQGCHLIGRIWTHTRTVMANFFVNVV